MADDYPMPGRSEFSADEEKAMRQGVAAARTSYPAGTATHQMVNQRGEPVGAAEIKPLMVHTIPTSDF